MLSDDFVALAPTYASTRRHLQPRYRAETSRTSRRRRVMASSQGLHHRDRYAANRGSGGSGGGEVVRRDSPAALVPRPPATPLMVRPVRGTHRAGRRRVGCPPGPQTAAATPAGPAVGEGGGEGMGGEDGGQGAAITTSTTLHHPLPPAGSTLMYLETLRPLGGPGGRCRQSYSRPRSS